MMPTCSSVLAAVRTMTLPLLSELWHYILETWLDPEDCWAWACASREARRVAGKLPRWPPELQWPLAKTTNLHMNPLARSSIRRGTVLFDWGGDTETVLAPGAVEMVLPAHWIGVAIGPVTRAGLVLVHVTHPLDGKSQRLDVFDLNVPGHRLIHGLDRDRIVRDARDVAAHAPIDLDRSPQRQCLEWLATRDPAPHANVVHAALEFLWHDPTPLKTMQRLVKERRAWVDDTGHWRPHRPKDF